MGLNAENASYLLGVYAERSTLVCAVTEGVRPGDVEAIAITTSPCGGYRQWLVEFRLDCASFMYKSELLMRRPTELIPDSFVLDS